MSIYKIIQELRSTRSKNEKESILSREKDNSELKEFFRLALDPFIKFYQKKDFSVGQNIGANSLSDAMDYLIKNIASRSITGYEAENGIIKLLESLSVEDAELIKLILKKDPDCGVDTTALKVWKGLYREYPTLLSSPFEPKLWDKYFANQSQYIVQLKSDGGRINIVIRDKVVSVMSRAGNELNIHGRFDFLAEFTNNVMIDGEMVVKYDGKIQSRKLSNGIFNKAVRNTLSVAESKSMHMVAWDIIDINVFDGKSTSPSYELRFIEITNLINRLNQPDAISLIETEYCETQEQAMGFYLRMRDRGEEGAMLKTLGHRWSNERSKEILKLKNIATADLRVVGANEGSGILAGNLGALCLETECGVVSVNCSGFPLKLRSQIWANITGVPVNYIVATSSGDEICTVYPGETTINIGSIVEVKYNEVIDDKRTGKKSLFLPRFSQERFDKTVANYFGELA